MLLIAPSARVIVHGMAMCTEIIELEREANRLGISANELCRRAGIARSTWTRWKAGVTSPRLEIWRRIERVLEEARPPVEAA